MDENRWNVADAKQKLSELLRRSESEPQLIFRRDEFVAAVVCARDAETVLKRAESASIADQFAEARALLERERYRLPSSARTRRKNDLEKVLDAVAGRHKRSQ